MLAAGFAAAACDANRFGHLLYRPRPKNIKNKCPGSGGPCPRPKTGHSGTKNKRPRSAGPWPLPKIRQWYILYASCVAYFALPLGGKCSAWRLDVAFLSASLWRQPDSEHPAPVSVGRPYASMEWLGENRGPSHIKNLGPSHIINSAPLKLKI